MSDKEYELFRIQQELTQLRIEIKNAESWIDRARDNLHNLQEIILDIKEKMLQ